MVISGKGYLGGGLMFGEGVCPVGLSSSGIDRRQAWVSICLTTHGTRSTNRNTQSVWADNKIQPVLLGHSGFLYSVPLVAISAKYEQTELDSRRRSRSHQHIY